MGVRSLFAQLKNTEFEEVTNVNQMTPLKRRGDGCHFPPHLFIYAE